MKKNIFFSLVLLSFTASGEVFTWATEKNKEVNVEIKKLDGVSVNLDCFKNKTACKKIIEAARKNKAEPKTDKGPLGNPASINCEFNKGQSEILRDTKHNEYDFCLFDQKFLIDSWDLMK